MDSAPRVTRCRFHVVVREYVQGIRSIWQIVSHLGYCTRSFGFAHLAMRSMRYFTGLIQTYEEKGTPHIPRYIIPHPSLYLEMHRVSEKGATRTSERNPLLKTT